MVRIGILLAAVTLSLTAAGEGPQTSGATAAFVEAGAARWEVPGIAVAVIRDGRAVHITRGTTNVDGGHEVTADTTFAIASTTKAMVAAAAAILVDRGELDWNARLLEYFPELRFADRYVTEQMRVVDLFTHSIGIPSTDLWTFGLDMPLEEQMARLAHVPPTAAYRQRFQYQNTLYELAGELIERVAGMPWYAFLKRELWTPLAMDNTWPSLAAARDSGADTVTPHHRVDGEVTATPFFPLPEDERDAAGSVWSSLRDMTRWAEFLLRGGVTADGERLISEAEFEHLFAPQVLIAEDDFYPTAQLTRPKWRSYGLGWFQQDYQGRRIDFHTGSLGGLCAIVGLDRDEGTAVVVLQNLDHAELRHAVMWEVYDPTRDWNKEVWDLYATLREKAEQGRRTFREARVSGTEPSRPLERYAGTYDHPAWGSIEIAYENGTLRAMLPNYEVTLEHWHYDTFLGHVVPWQTPQPVRFELGYDGQPKALVAGDIRYERLTSR
jgi:CubicO group peptidase (beta-lactamase class C family)